MKKKRFWATVIIIIALLSISTSASASECFSDENAATDMKEWGWYTTDGFYTKDNLSPFYMWLYAPDGKLLKEGYVKMYTYKPEAGYAHISFDSGDSYYTSPSNFYMIFKDRNE